MGNNLFPFGVQEGLRKRHKDSLSRCGTEGKILFAHHHSQLCSDGSWDGSEKITPEVSHINAKQAGTGRGEEREKERDAA